MQKRKKKATKKLAINRKQKLNYVQKENEEIASKII